MSVCPDTANATANFSCECLPGYTGEDCSVNIDECASNPCGENGNCTDAVNGFICDCEVGFTGETCSMSIGDMEFECDLDCENGGKCVQDGERTYCLCSGGFTGSFCQSKSH